jgi:hypothetical protein
MGAHSLLDTCGAGLPYKRSLMLFQKWLVIDKLEFIDSLPPSVLQDEVAFCWFPSTPAHLLKKQTLLFLSRTEYRVAVGVPGITWTSPVDETELLTTGLIRLFFQTSYAKRDQVPYLITDQPISFENPFFRHLNDSCQEQGFRSINLLYMNRANSLVLAALNNASLSQQFSQEADRWLGSVASKKPVSEIPIFIRTDLHNDPVTAMELVSSLEKQLVEQDPRLALAAVLLEQGTHTKAVEIEVRNLKKQVNDLQAYLVIQKTESKYLLNWYQNEYEILPLWYKRLGHIIKVLTGKRSFRSLFRDDVKKYNP